MSLTRAGVVFDYEWFIENIGIKEFRRMKKTFTIITMGHNCTQKTASAVRLVRVVDCKNDAEVNDSSVKRIKIFVPRFGAFMMKDANIIKDIHNALSKGEDAEFKSTVVPTANQKLLLEWLTKNVYTSEKIESGRAGATVQMDPGQGKTFLAMAVIASLKKKTFFIVPNTYLYNQTIKLLKQFFPGTQIGSYCGKKKEDGDIVVGIINCSLKFPSYNKFGLIVYDESHKYCSNKFSKIYYTAQARCVLAITATPYDRIDKFDNISHWSLGSVVRGDSLKGWNPDETIYKTKAFIVRYNGPKEYTETILSSTGEVSVPLMLNQIVEDPYRNRLIIDLAIKTYNTDRNVFVFSDRCSHLASLAAVLRERKVKYYAPELDDFQEKNMEGIKELMGGATADDVKDANDNGRIILTTYPYSGTGVSIVKMNALIVATPRRNGMRQIIGRIYRMSGDSTVERWIIDIVDNRTSLKSQLGGRKKEYKSRCAVMKEFKTTWDKGDILSVKLE